MPRNILQAFFRRVIVSSLPLAFACDGIPAAATVELGATMDASAAADDLSVGDDLSPDVCEVQNPPTLVSLGDASLPDAWFNGNCYYMAPCTDYCPPGYTLCCGPLAADGGEQLLNCVYYCGPAGRRPPGLAPAAAQGGCTVGEHFAKVAHLEAASVHAFRILARELAREGAPERLVRAARRAACDEIRHARVTARLAHAHGCRPSPVVVAPAPHRSLAAIAIENAIEGCVRETFAALTAAWQARAAGDARVRRAMAAVAVDEADHARLAWDVDAWARTRLGRAALRRVDAARRDAVAILASEIAEPPAALRDHAGLPTAGRARYFLEATRAHLWA